MDAYKSELEFNRRLAKRNAERVAGYRKVYLVYNQHSNCAEPFVVKVLATREAAENWINHPRGAGQNFTISEEIVWEE